MNYTKARHRVVTVRYLSFFDALVCANPGRCVSRYGTVTIPFFFLFLKMNNTKATHYADAWATATREKGGSFFFFFFNELHQSTSSSRRLGYSNTGKGDEGTAGVW
jgi:hypothetical protein